MRYIKYSFGICLIFWTYIVAKFLSLIKKEEIWLISERSDEAEDNSFFLFKYIRETYPEQEVYYLIDYKSKAYKKLKEYGNTINYNSIKHYIYYFLSTTHISAFQFFGVPDDPLIWKMESWGLFKKKRIFLQHGITKEKLPFLMYENTKYDLFICGAYPEYQYVKENYGYPEGSVKYVGLCRFDNLHNTHSERKILIMPTWRKWIGMTSKRLVTDEDREKFLNTQYFQTYQSLINNKVLQNFLEGKRIKLQFYPHPEMQKYINLFHCESSYVEIVSRESSNLQELMMESMLLITDYSSIAFDRAYLKKPLIYYQFDQEEYYDNHFEKSYFDVENDGFGPVIKDELHLVETMIKMCSMSKMDEEYIARSKKFFPLYDDKNCERTYEAIKELFIGSKKI